MAGRDLLRLEYVPLSQVILWDRNPKLHDVGSLVESIGRHGFKDPLKFEPALNGGQGGVVEGNGRGEALAAMQRQGDEPPRGIDVVKDTGEWAVPVLFGVDADSEAAAEAYGVDHNNLTLLGADGVTPWDLARMWDDEGYLALLGELAAADALPVSMDGEDFDRLLNPEIDYDELWQGMPEFEQEDSFGAISSIKVHFATEEAIEQFAKLVEQTVTKNTTYIWYPKQEREDLKKYVAHES